MCIRDSRQANPKLLIVLDMNDARLEKAKEFGADLVMNPGKEDVVAKIKELTGGSVSYTHLDVYKRQP